jgi:hypothetical protein
VHDVDGGIEDVPSGHNRGVTGDIQRQFQLVHIDAMIIEPPRADIKPLVARLHVTSDVRQQIAGVDQLREPYGIAAAMATR